MLFVTVFEVTDLEFTVISSLLVMFSPFLNVTVNEEFAFSHTTS